MRWVYVIAVVARLFVACNAYWCAPEGWDSGYCAYCGFMSNSWGTYCRDNRCDYYHYDGSSFHEIACPDPCTTLPGQYCNRLVPTDCPVNAYCPMFEMSSPIYCDPGTYSMELRAFGSSACSLTCPAGAFCANGLNETCRAGFWSASGASACTPCAAGTYGTAVGATSQAKCVSCAAGTYSSGGGTLNETCGAGFWSASGASACTPCVAGTYGTAIGATSPAVCVPCVAGTYCTGGVAVPCTAGDIHCASANMTAPMQCSVCAPGQYVTNRCTALSDSVCTACPPYTFSVVNWAESCTPIGTCAVGTYFVSASQGCQPCLTGFYCPDVMTKTACEAGYACPSGSSEPVACTGNNFCVAGTNAPVPCTTCGAGTYETAACSIFANAKCAACPTGSYYCLGGKSVPQGCTACAVGFYTKARCTSSMNTQCSVCPSGSLCLFPDAMSPVACDSGYHSTDGSTACFMCPSNTYSTASPAGCLACPANSTTPAATGSSGLGFYSIPGSQFFVSAVHSQQQACVGSSYSLDSTYAGNPCGWTVVWGERGQPDGSKYMELNLTRVTFVDGIATAGKPSGWICSMMVNISVDGVTWSKAIASANTNWDATTIVATPLMAYAKYIRIYPTCATTNRYWENRYWVYYFTGALRAGLQLRSSGCTCAPGHAKQLKWTALNGFQECNACEPGTYVSATQTACEQCASGTFNPQYASRCLACLTSDALQCRTGTFFWACNRTTDSMCAACPTGDFFCTGSAQIYNCTRRCGVGYYESQACSAFTDRVCGACPVNFFCPAGNVTAAVNCTRCAPAYYESAPCTNSTNRQCKACPAGKVFCNGSVTIANCTPSCAVGSYRARECTNATDLLCPWCTVCSTGGDLIRGAGLSCILTVILQVPTKRRRAPTPRTPCARRVPSAPSASETGRSRTAPPLATSGRTRRRRVRTGRTGCAPGAPMGIFAWTRWWRRLVITRRARPERTRRRPVRTSPTSCARRVPLGRTAWGDCTSTTAPCRASKARTRRPRARTARIACAPGAASSSSARTGCAATRAGRGARGSCTRRRPARM
jgi:hypothetical protein